MESVSAWEEVIEFIKNGLWELLKLKISNLPTLNLSIIIIGITAIIIFLIIKGAKTIIRK